MGKFGLETAHLTFEVVKLGAVLVALCGGWLGHLLPLGDEFFVELGQLALFLGNFTHKRLPFGLLCVPSGQLVTQIYSHRRED